MLHGRESLGSEPLLSAEEERDLAYQIEAGVLAEAVRLSGRPWRDATEAELALIEERGERARQRFIRANLRMVAKAARQAAGRSGLPDSDLFQEGCLGLICAVERFDCNLGFRFSTYAMFWVRAYIGAATANLLGAMNLPTSRAAQLRTLLGVEVELAQSFGRPATVAEVASWFGRSEQWVAELLAHRAPQLVDDVQIEHAAPAADSNSCESVLDHDRPGAELLWHLKGLARQVMLLRYGFDDGRVHSYAEIGRLLDVSVSRVRRMENQALEILRSVCPQDAYLHL
jgi:RNA polymerase primary sigma factor/RNA polymerase nonessential primary-like sigma factor